ncbi:YeiH family protein [Moorella sulfitireducens]|uniref:YeiH family protein n=1 Tax=Neomoorella sulfitireducens TaxID=2972948 RepID=UPI0021AC0C19|nr:putative sulfate exporter family transporter [Moorella sulfitireducens]
MSTKSLTATDGNQGLGLIQGLGLTIMLALVARQLATLPILNIMGSMVLAILLGIAWRSFMAVPETAEVGINYASKKILRYGIILMGLRLDIPEIVAAGPQVIILDALAIFLAMVVITFLGQKLGLNKKLATLIAAGTGICGAAAIAAVAPVVRSRDDETAVAVAIIALLGTLFTIIYTLLYPVINLTSYEYGLFSGSSLHELAHVIAAAQAGGSASTDIAILVKLGRVALLVPVALLLGIIFASRNKTGTGWNWCQLQVPWFIFGFLALSGLNTMSFLPVPLTATMIQGGVFLLTMAMAGLGLNVSLEMIKRVGTRGLVIGLVGSVVLSLTLLLVITSL